MNCARAMVAFVACYSLMSLAAFGQLVDEVDSASGKSKSWTRPPGGGSSKTGGGWTRPQSPGAGGSSYVPQTGRPATRYVPSSGNTQQAAKPTIKRNAPPKQSKPVVANPTPRRTLAENDPPEQVVLGPAGLVVDKEDVIDEDEKAKKPIDVTGGDVAGEPQAGFDPNAPDQAENAPTVRPRPQDDPNYDPTKLTGIDSPTIPMPPATEPAPAPAPTPSTPASDPASQLGQEAAEPLGQEAADPTTADAVVVPPTGGNTNSEGGSSANTSGGNAGKLPTWTRPSKSDSGGSSGTKPAGSNAGGSASASAGNAGQALPKQEFVNENERADRPQFGVGGLVIVPSGSNAKPNPAAHRDDYEPEDTPARPPMNSGDPRTEAKSVEIINKQYIQETGLEGQWQDEQGKDFVKRHGPRPIDAEGAANWDNARRREIESWGRQRKLEELRRQRKQ